MGENPRSTVTEDQECLWTIWKLKPTKKEENGQELK